MTHDERNRLHLELMKKTLAEMTEQKWEIKVQETKDRLAEEDKKYVEQQYKFSQSEFLNKTYSI